MFKYIVESISMGARFAATTFRAFKIIDALLTSFANFQLVVDSILILNCEGARTLPDGSSKFIVASHLEGKNKAELDSHGERQQLQMLTFEGAQTVPNHSYQLIVGYVAIPK